MKNGVQEYEVILIWSFWEVCRFNKRTVRDFWFSRESVKTLKTFCNENNIHFSAATAYGRSIVSYWLPGVLDMVNNQVVGTFTFIVIFPLKSSMEDRCRFDHSVGKSAIVSRLV